MYHKRNTKRDLKQVGSRLPITIVTLFIINNSYIIYFYLSPTVFKKILAQYLKTDKVGIWNDLEE